MTIARLPLAVLLAGLRGPRRSRLPEAAPHRALPGRQASADRVRGRRWHSTRRRARRQTQRRTDRSHAGRHPAPRRSHLVLQVDGQERRRRQPRRAVHGTGQIGPLRRGRQAPVDAARGVAREPRPGAAPCDHHGHRRRQAAGNDRHDAAQCQRRAAKRQPLARAVEPAPDHRRPTAGRNQRNRTSTARRPRWSTCWAAPSAGGMRPPFMSGARDGN